MKNKILGLLMIVCLIVLTGCNKVPKLANGQELVARIDGKDITVEDLYDAFDNQNKTSALINLIDKFIAENEIETNDDIIDKADAQLEQIRYNFESTGQDFQQALKSYGFNDEDELLDEIIIGIKIQKVAENYYKEQLTDKEIETYYEEEIFGEMDVRHILIKPEQKDNDEEQKEAIEEAKKRAEEVIAKLDEGANFEDLVEEYSDDTGSVEDGGLIKDVSKDTHVLEFFEASLELEEGEYTKTPVKTTYGYHVILKVKQDEKPSLEEVKDMIVDELVAEKMNDATTNPTQVAWAEVRKSYNLEFFDTNLKTTYEANISLLNTQN